MKKPNRLLAYVELFKYKGITFINYSIKPHNKIV